MIYAAKTKPGEYHSVQKSNKRGRTEVAVFMSAGRESLWKSKNSVGERSALRRVSYTCSLESCVRTRAPWAQTYPEGLEGLSNAEESFHGESGV